MKIKEVVSALERFAPLPLQADFDNAGLQVGLTEAEVSGALLCLDVTEQIVDEAVRLGCNLIVSHHPLIFRKLSCVCGADYVQRAIIKAIKNDVAIVSMHTNMDSAWGGVNCKIAEKMGLENLRFFGKQREVAVPGDTDGDRPVMVRGGDGVIGEFAKPMAADDFVTMLKRVFDVECLMTNQLLRREIRKVAICGGAGSFLLGEAIGEGADAFVTGEMGYHDYFGHEQQIQIAVMGHYQSEQYTNEVFRDIVQDACHGVPCHMAKTNTNPIIYL
ncbi:NGG1p interacting factor 3 protein, NIF3 [Prevotella sp. S7-1-8]|uniref:Nif3-like dinuclear metal center hexameric protein n=1 Tax=Prevotella sp. S7-1-8 TaxID=1284775 RepID=UPI00050DFC78|nr:Nif3-like dinuclear metal center hexameric protein [Prevotella sp. S7-1-8]KGF18431.1 NGG1p interacting factor 3 protein, NIF3 [Prevotella sp. S7-1-8]